MYNYVPTLREILDKWCNVHPVYSMQHCVKCEILEMLVESRADLHKGGTTLLHATFVAHTVSVTQNWQKQLPFLLFIWYHHNFLRLICKGPILTYYFVHSTFFWLDDYLSKRTTWTKTRPVHWCIRNPVSKIIHWQTDKMKPILPWFNPIFAAFIISRCMVLPEFWQFVEGFFFQSPIVN